MSNFSQPHESDAEDARTTQVLDRGNLDGGHIEGADNPDDDDEEFDDDDEFAPQPRQRLGKLSALLLAGLVLGLGFLGGILVQKHDGGSSSRAATFSGAGGARAAFGGATGAGGAGRAGGFGAGGFGGAGTTGAGGTTGTGGATGTGGTGTGSGTAASTLAVVGQIVSVSGNTVVVKNLGGKDVTVHLSGDTKITITITAASLKAGQSVAVSGSTAADGSVTATNVTGQ